MSDLKTSTELEKSRLLAPDALRVISLLLVILLHSSDNYVSSFNTFTPTWTWLIYIIHTPTRISVQLFFMISGWLLLSKKEETLKDFFRKRFLRIVPPFLFYLVLFYLWEIFYQGEKISFRIIISDILNDRLPPHFWFVYAIVGLYLLTPILRVLVQHANKQILRYMIVLWFIAVGIIPFLERVWGYEISAPYVFHIEGFVGYFLMGYILKDLILNRKQIFWLGGLLLVLFTTIMIGIHTMSSVDGQFNWYFYYYLNPFYIISSMIAFSILKSLPFEKFYRKWPSSQNLVVYLSSITYGIYLLHPLFKIMLRSGALGIAIHEKINPPWVGIPVFFGVSLALSVVLVSILRKIPGLKYFAT